ncbi:MAG: STAS domain-containing protein [Candidatus Aminicenantes bacterium]|nr:STAS domain-containing protein [Candidatus Aminicenantes bacterium]
MKLDVTHKNGVIIIKPLGKRIDARVASEFKSDLITFVKNGNEKIVLDLSDVDFIDSSGLGVLVLVMRKLGAGGKICLCKVKESVKSIFQPNV